MTKDFRYEMICPICGYSFTGERIEARRRCEKCGVRLSERHCFFRLGQFGELIEDESESKERGGEEMAEKLADMEIAELWEWAFNTAGYWLRSLDVQENKKDCALVIINRDDWEKIMKIEKLSFEIGNLRQAQKGE